jgi:hypothetical protein
MGMENMIEQLTIRLVDDVTLQRLQVNFSGFL